MDYLKSLQDYKRLNYWFEKRRVCRASARSVQQRWGICLHSYVMTPIYINRLPCVSRSTTTHCTFNWFSRANKQLNTIHHVCDVLDKYCGFSQVLQFLRLRGIFAYRRYASQESNTSRQVKLAAELLNSVIVTW